LVVTVINNKHIKELNSLQRNILLPNLAVACAYLLLARIGLTFSLNESGATVFWPAGGLALAMLLLKGPRLLPGVYIGAMGAGFMVGGSFIFSALTALGNVLETFLGYWLLTHYRYIDRSLGSVQDMLRLVVYGACISPLMSAVIGPATFVMFDAVESRYYPEVFLRWWMADSIGIAFVTPLILVWRTLPQGIFVGRRSWEALVLFASTFLFAQAVFFGWFSHDSYQYVSVSWLFPFIIWAGLRAGRHGVTIVQLMLFTQGLLSAGNEKGYFAEDLAHGSVLDFWMFGVVVAVGGMLLAIVSTAKLKVEKALADSEKRHRAIINSSMVPMILVDRQRHITLMNPAFLKTYGYELEDVPTLADLLLKACPDAQYRDWVQHAWYQHITAVESAKSAEPVELKIQCGDGTTKTAHISVAPLGDSLEGALVVHVIDVTERMQANQKLLLAAEVFKHSLDGILITDAGHNMIAVNDAFTHITGYPEAEVLGRNPKLLGSGMHDESFYKGMWESLAATGRWQGEIWNRRKNGECYPEWLSAFSVKDIRGKVVNYVGIFSDITERKASEEYVKHQAQHDFLTNLPNRIMFNDRLQRQIAHARRNTEVFALLYLDLDNFKPVNDEFGHHIGDALLQAVAGRLKALTREVDTVSRRGGDEFIILTPDIESADNAKVLADKLITAIEAPFHIEGYALRVTLSIGIAMFPYHGADEDALMKNADVAMYQAKKGGRNTYRFYDLLH